MSFWANVLNVGYYMTAASGQKLTKRNLFEVMNYLETNFW